MYTAHHMPLTGAFGTLHAVASEGLTVTVKICDACCAYVHRLTGRAKPVTGWDLSVLQKEALTTLVDLVTAHQGNTACLIGLTDLCHSVFTQSLPLCGDFGLQVCLRACPHLSHEWASEPAGRSLSKILLLGTSQDQCPVQVDIIELLYRCAKHGTVPPSYLTALSTKVRFHLLYRDSVHHFYGQL